MKTPQILRATSRKLLVSLLMGMTMFCSQSLAETKTSRIIIKEKRNSACHLKELIAEKGFQCREMIPQLGIISVDVPEMKVESFLMESECAVDYAEREGEGVGNENDPYYLGGAQWHLAKIKAEEAWKITKGSESVIVAVLDTGVDYNHPDLIGNVMRTGGYDFVNNDPYPLDDNGHGTGVAGCISPRTGNNLGVSGVSWNTKILPIKVLNSQNRGYNLDIAKGIIHAADMGADIINISYSSGAYSHVIEDAVDYAWNKNCVIIASAGNKGTDNARFPASLENVVSVSASTYVDTLSFFSNFGNSVDICAPGAGIMSLTTGGKYKGWNGTSFAAPITAGVAALIASSPQVTTNQQIVDILLNSADDLGSPGFDDTYGHGRVNAESAVQLAFSVASASSAVDSRVSSQSETSLQVVDIIGDVLVMDVNVPTGTHYTIESSDDMDDWNPAYTGVSNGESRINLPQPREDCGFFRLNLNEES